MSDLKENLERDTASAEGDGTENDAVMKNNQNVEDTGQPNLLPPQVAGTAGSDISADGSPPTAASAQCPPAKAVVESQE